MSNPEQPARHSRWAWAALALTIVVVAGIAIGALTGGDDSGASAPAAAAATASSGGTTAAAGGSSNAGIRLIRRVSTTPLQDGGKPVLFFMGAHFCPFCASERWAFVKATSRFGTWTGLRPLKSADGDGFGRLATYDFVHATYRSSVFKLRHKEVATVSGGRLQQLDGFESALVNAYNPRGSIPFIAAGSNGGQYTVELPYSPSLLKGQSFDGLRRAIAANDDTPVVRAINDEADAITALMCRLGGGHPASVCKAKPIAALGTQLE